MPCPFTFYALFYYCNFSIPPTHHGCNFHHSLASTDPVTEMWDPSSVESPHLLPTTALALSFVFSKLRVAGLSPRYSRASNVFKVKVKVVLQDCLFYLMFTCAQRSRMLNITSSLNLRG